MNKPVTPYARLLQSFKEYARAVEYRQRVTMWLYPMEKLSERWNLLDLYERTKAAEQLGYDVLVSAEDEGIVVRYIKKIPSRPWVVQ
jgi:hypothetical protein